MFTQFYLFVRSFIRHRILYIDDRPQLGIAVADGLKMGKIVTFWENVSLTLDIVG